MACRDVNRSSLIYWVALTGIPFKLNKTCGVNKTHCMNKTHGAKKRHGVNRTLVETRPKV